MPNWTLLRLREKAKADMAESIFRRIEERNRTDHKKAETVDEFLKRGGQICLITERRK